MPAALSSEVLCFVFLWVAFVLISLRFRRWPLLSALVAAVEEKAGKNQEGA